MEAQQLHPWMEVAGQGPQGAYSTRARQSSKELLAGLQLRRAEDTPGCSVSWRGILPSLHSLAGYFFPQITTYERALASPILSTEQLCASSTY